MIKELPEVSICAEIKCRRRVVSSHGPIMGGGLDSSPLDGASTAASSPRNDFVKNYWVHATH